MHTSRPYGTGKGCDSLPALKVLGYFRAVPGIVSAPRDFVFIVYFMVNPADPRPFGTLCGLVALGGSAC